MSKSPTLFKRHFICLFSPYCRLLLAVVLFSLMFLLIQIQATKSHYGKKSKQPQHTDNECHISSYELLNLVKIIPYIHNTRPMTTKTLASVTVIVSPDTAHPTRPTPIDVIATLRRSSPMARIVFLSSGLIS